jgi:hypothetical protein
MRLATGVFLTTLTAFILFVSTGCGAEGPSVDVELYGYDATSGQFVSRLGDYIGAEQVRVSLSRPLSGRSLSTETFPVGSGSATLPELQFGNDSRLEFTLLERTSGGRLEPLASGATPLFDVQPETEDTSLWLMLAAANTFSPVGERYSNAQSSARWDYRQVTFDERGLSGGGFAGRTGHRTAVASRGRVLFVGGAPNVEQALLDGTVPELNGVHDDVQFYDTTRGRMINLGYDPGRDRPRPNGADRLAVGRAYHTVTKIGPQRFLVAGGLTLEDGDTVASGALEIIDLDRLPGERVRSLRDESGEIQVMDPARAFHSATYLPEQGVVVLAGGLRTDGSTVSTVELVDVETGAVTSAGELSNPRAQHRAVRADDDQVWVLGGWAPASGALRSTELLSVEDGTLEVNSDIMMQDERYAFGATPVEFGPENSVVVCGGYTSFTSKDKTGTCELLVQGRSSQESWTMGQAVSGLEVFALTGSEDLVTVGGRNPEGMPVGATRLAFRGSGGTSFFEPDGSADMLTARHGASSEQLTSGLIIVSGGIGDAGGSDVTLETLEYYNPVDIVPAAESAN